MPFLGFTGINPLYPLTITIRRLPNTPDQRRRDLSSSGGFDADCPGGWVLTGFDRSR